MNTVSEKAIAPSNLPEFTRIMEAFQAEIERADSLNYALYGLSMNLNKTKEEPAIKDPNPIKDPNSITERVWASIWRLREINNANEFTINHLREVIGEI